MSLARLHTTRAAIWASTDALCVWRHPLPQPEAIKGQPTFVASDPEEGPEPLVVVWRDGSVSALCGHVDLGTGLRTALTQIVAEELDVPMASVHLIMGSTQVAGKCRIDLHLLLQPVGQTVQREGRVAADEVVAGVAAAFCRRICINAVQRTRQLQFVLERFVAAQARAHHQQGVDRLVERLGRFLQVV